MRFIILLGLFALGFKNQLIIPGGDYGSLDCNLYGNSKMYNCGFFLNHDDNNGSPSDLYRLIYDLPEADYDISLRRFYPERNTFYPGNSRFPRLVDEGGKKGTNRGKRLGIGGRIRRGIRGEGGKVFFGKSGFGGETGFGKRLGGEGFLLPR